jgi:hypothetical protein
MSFPEVKSHELASCLPAKLTSAARPALTPSQRQMSMSDETDN